MPRKLRNKILAYFAQVDNDTRVYTSNIAEFFGEDFWEIDEILDNLWCEGVIDNVPSSADGMSPK